ncbi:MAG TPA: glycosyltransferase family 39 protein [Verrucomicrobiae bacterium]|jgi:hypothetical protein|nr:glycosyltransferase family 39 protein [Verrucomicrobiae bacterium]
MKEIIGLVRRNLPFFLITTLAGLALRLFFVLHFPHFSGDSLVYGELATNLFKHGILGFTDGQSAQPTMVRLPGYPGFLALVFAIFGQEHYTAAMIVQALVDLNTCLVIAALALTISNAHAIVNERRARIAYVLAALCPFTASYSGAVLAETLSICCTAHALYYGARAIKALAAGESSLLLWLVAGAWTGAGVMMRPDGGFVLIALAMALLVLLFRSARKQRVLLAGTLFALISLAPLVPWTIRNWRQFHVFQPVPTAAATDPGEFVPHGFGRWARTWMVDFVSVEEFGWPVPGDPVDFHLLPQRAFDSRREYETTEKLIAEYNARLTLDADLDAKFGDLARERIIHNPFRYYVWLPFLRISDMWLRPRTELLPIESRWWEFSDHPEESTFALAWAALNLFYLIAAFRGWLKLRLGTVGVALIGYMLIRSAYLGNVGPEPRYVLECFPIVIVLAGAGLARTRSGE